MCCWDLEVAVEQAEDVPFLEGLSALMLSQAADGGPVWAGIESEIGSVACAGAPWSGGDEPAELQHLWQEQEPWPLEPNTDTHTFQVEAAQMLQGLSDDEVCPPHCCDIQAVNHGCQGGV